MARSSPPLFAATAASLLLFGLVSCDRQARDGDDVADPAQAAANAESDSVRLDSIQRARQDSINRARPDYVVDSILPIEEQLRRFRDGLPQASRFAGGASSRDALIAAIIDGVERSDSAGLDRLTLSLAEFAWLVYPTSAYASGPMQQAPQLTWFMLSNSSERGRSRLLARLGGSPLGVQSTRCVDAPVREGANTVVTNCLVTRTDAERGDVEQRLFGTLIARDGVWKVMSWANGF